MPNSMSEALHSRRTKKQVKFCGFTRSEDIQVATQLGVDAIGLVFYPPSPRNISVQAAAQLVREVSAFTTVVALIVNMSESDLQYLANNLDFDIIQFHGDESPSDCQRLAKLINKRWIKALRINAESDTTESILQTITDFHNAGASSILLDAYHKQKYGGTGERFDWSIIPKNSPLPLILAGGLSPENVSATNELPIAAVDVSGGIESDKGIKNSSKMINFIKNLNSV